MTIAGPAAQLRQIAATLRDAVYYKDKLPLEQRANLADRLEQIAADVAKGKR